MSRRPLLLDLYCGAGGAGMGYHRAGFRVVGVDHRPQPNYPFRFIRADALEYAEIYGPEYDALHASPPCQAHSMATRYHRGASARHTDLVAPTRKLLLTLAKPWIIENVVGAPMVNALTLCGLMFGLRTYRHRRFESSALLLCPQHSRHLIRAANPGDRAAANEFWCTTGHLTDARGHGEALGVDWMAPAELSQSIPPAYTEFLGRQLIGATGARD